ncbi:MAG: iduronate-2-sulfatase [Lentisphaerae bacterium]|nr:MAG: iduronate-2-sulfatase [Lentisphaerota bacterium]
MHLSWSRLVAGGAAFAAPLLGAVVGETPSPTRNILFIFVDDLRPELGCYGQQIVPTPNIDRLARNGVLFTRAYCQQAVCAPSRVSTMSACRPDTTRVWDLNHPINKFRPNLPTVPQWLKQHGYQTVSLGKIYHHGNDDFPKGWTERPWHPSWRTADGKIRWVGWQAYVDPGNQKIWQEQNRLIQKARKAGKKAPAYASGPAYEMADVGDEAYPDGLTAREAVRRLQQFAQTKKPFFLAVGFVKPHLPFNAPKRYWDMVNVSRIRLSPYTEWPEGSPSFARMNWGELRHYYGIPKTGKLPRELALRLIHGYYACVAYTDAQVGKVLDALRKLELDRNTVIALVGDHGWKLSEYSAWCKHTNYEIDAHVPLIFAGPGIAKGARYDGLVEMVDILPTLTDWAGLPLNHEVWEGISLLPVLKNPQLPGKKAVFNQYPRGYRDPQTNKYVKLMGYAVRTDRWRYVEWRTRSQPVKVVARELYDHSQPGRIDLKNLAELPQYQATVKQLSQILKGGWRKALPPWYKAPVPQAPVH